MQAFVDHLYSLFAEAQDAAGKLAAVHTILTILDNTEAVWSTPVAPGCIPYYYKAVDVAERAQAEVELLLAHCHHSQEAKLEGLRLRVQTTINHYFRLSRLALAA